jgi:hypothetical protein
VYLHAKKKIHRDVKPQNILVGDAGIPKLADFGIAGQLGGDRTRTDTMIGTPYFLAPEIIVNESGYNERVDVWATGISMIQLAEMAPPHADVNPMRALLLITTSEAPTLKHPERWSLTFNDFLARTLVKEPADRPSAADILTHPFIADNPEPNAMRDYVASLAPTITRMRSRDRSQSVPRVAHESAAVPVLPKSELARASAAASAAASSDSDGDDGDDTPKSGRGNGSHRSNKTPRSHRDRDNKKSSKSSTKDKKKSKSKESSSTARDADVPPPPHGEPRPVQRAATDIKVAAAPPGKLEHSASLPGRPAAPPAPPPLSVVSGMPVCVACGEPIDAKHMVVGESRWHKEHFRCSVCDELLSKDGFVHKDGSLFCRPHYHERYSPLCGGCGERITAGGYVSALGQSWHPDHLVCAACKQPFKSARFIAKANKPFCDKDCHANYLKAAASKSSASVRHQRTPSGGGGGSPLTRISSSCGGARRAAAAATRARAAARGGVEAQQRRAGQAADVVAASASASTSATSTLSEASFSEHLNRFAFFKKFYLEICTEQASLPDASFVAYIDSCIALRRKVNVLRLGDVSSQPWSAQSLLMVARAIVRASTFTAPQNVNFTENMGISSIDLSNASLGGEHVEALVTLLGCSFPLRELLFANNPGLGKKALVDLSEALCRRKSLQRVDIAGCGVGDKVLQQLLGDLCKLKSDFQALDLSNNLLTAAAGQFVGDFAASNAQLHELRLSGNKIGDKGVVDLVKRLQMPQHTSLRVLTLASTGLKRGVELAQWINENAKHRSSLADCLFLAELDVSNNALDADFAQYAGQLDRHAGVPDDAQPVVEQVQRQGDQADHRRPVERQERGARPVARRLRRRRRRHGGAVRGAAAGSRRHAAARVRLSLRDCSISERRLLDARQGDQERRQAGRARRRVQQDVGRRRRGAGGGDRQRQRARRAQRRRVPPEQGGAGAVLQDGAPQHVADQAAPRRQRLERRGAAGAGDGARVQHAARAAHAAQHQRRREGAERFCERALRLCHAAQAEARPERLEKAPAAFAERLTRFKFMSVQYK